MKQIKVQPYTLKPHPFVVAQLHHCVTPNIEKFTRISSNNEINSKFKQVQSLCIFKPQMIRCNICFDNHSSHLMAHITPLLTLVNSSSNKGTPFATPLVVTSVQKFATGKKKKKALIGYDTLVVVILIFLHFIAFGEIVFASYLEEVILHRSIQKTMKMNCKGLKHI